MLCWNFSAGNLDFCKGCRVCGLLCKTAFSRHFWNVAERGCSWFRDHCRVDSQDWGLYDYCPMHRWARLCPVPWHMVLDSTAPTKALSFPLWMDGKCFWRVLCTTWTYDQPCCRHHPSRDFWRNGTWSFFVSCSVHAANLVYLLDG